MAGGAGGELPWARVQVTCVDCSAWPLLPYCRPKERHPTPSLPPPPSPAPLTAGIIPLLLSLSTKVDALSSEMKALQLADGVSSVVSPLGKEYERVVDTRVNDWLHDLCGLRVLPASRRRVAEQDPSSGRVEWDGRFSVSLVHGWMAPPHVEDFLVYSGGMYMPPPPVTTPRKLSPLKPTAGTEYLAVLEYTRRPNWTREWTDRRGVHKSLIQRLEERLSICVRRAIDAGMETSATVGDIVALVGIVGEDDCQESFEALMSDASCPHELLKLLFNARRVVFFRCSFTQHTTTASVSSPRLVSSRGGGGTSGEGLAEPAIGGAREP